MTVSSCVKHCTVLWISYESTDSCRNHSLSTHLGARTSTMLQDNDNIHTQERPSLYSNRYRACRQVWYTGYRIRDEFVVVFIIPFNISVHLITLNDCNSTVTSQYLKQRIARTTYFSVRPPRNAGHAKVAASIVRAQMPPTLPHGICPNFVYNILNWLY